MLRNRNFLFLWLAQWISAAGDTFTFLALAVRIDSFYPDAGESARALGGVFIAMALPPLLVGLFAGTLVDRLDRRRLMIASDLLRAALVPAYLLVRGPEDLTLAFIIAFLLSTFSVVFYPARTALVPALVTEEDLMSANGWLQVGRTVAMLSGPVLAGIVVGRWGTQVSFVVDAVSYLISALLVAGIWGVVTRAVSAAQGEHSSWEDLKAGVRYAMGSRLLQGITVGISVAMLGLGAVNVLFVPFLRHVFNAPPEALGVVQTAQGVGMLIGGLVMGGLGKRLSPLVVSMAAMALLAGSVVALGLAPAYAVVLLTMPLAGLSVAPLNASLQTLLQRGVPGPMLGRAGAVMDMAISLTNVISMGAAGWLGDALGVRQTFVLGGVLLMVGGLVMGWLLRNERSAQVVSGEKTGATLAAEK